MVLTVLHLRNEQGEQYRKTLQYGYDRQQGIDRWMGMRLNNLDPWRTNKWHDVEITDDMYACGFLPPRYPVPSIWCDTDVVYSGILEGTDLLVILFVDGEVLVS